MRLLRAVVVLTFFLEACASSSARQSSPIAWRPKSISYALEQGSSHGQYVRLTQSGSPSDRSWGVIRLDVPDAWEVTRLEMVGESLELELADQRLFRVNGANLSELLFAIEELGPRERPDPDLNRVWQEHAESRVPESSARRRLTSGCS